MGRGAVRARRSPYPHAFPPWFHLLFLAAFAGTGAALLWVARTDRRARAFGVVLVSFGTVFADPLLRHALLTADGLQAGIGQLLLRDAGGRLHPSRAVATSPASFPPASHAASAGSIPSSWPSSPPAWASPRCW